MTSRMLDSSYLTQRKGNLAQANSFFTRLNTSGTPNTTQYGPQPGIFDSSIINNVKMGNMPNFNRTNGCTTVSYGCPCNVTNNNAISNITVPTEVINLFVYLGSIIISWDPPLNASGNMTYILQIYQDDILINTIENVSSPYIFNDYITNDTYKFAVIAQNEAGQSPSVETPTFLAPPITIPSNLYINSIYISDTNNVYLYNDNTFIVQNPNNTVSIGGFESILNTIPILPSSYGVSSIMTLDNNTIFIAYFEEGTNTGLQGVYKSINGGLSWTNITTTLALSELTFVNGAYFWDNNNGIIYGDAIDDGVNPPYLLMYWTNDGGQTWNLSSGVNCNSNNSSLNNMQSISIIDNTIFYQSYSTTGGLVIYKSTDMGHNFVKYNIAPPAGGLTGGRISFSTLLNGVSVSSSKYFYTTDGGMTWTDTINTLGTSNIACVPNSDIVYSIGLNNTIYVCTDYFTNSTKLFTVISNIDNIRLIRFNNNTGSGAGYSSSSANYIKRYNVTSIPSIPAILNVVAANQSAIITFNASTFFPTNSITINTYSNGNFVKTDTFTTVSILTQLIITGLTNGTAYTFRAKSTNTIGDSPLSVMSNSVIPAPGAPFPVPELNTSIMRFGADQNGIMSMTAIWLPPSSDNGSPITGYRFTANSDTLLPPQYVTNLPPYTLGTLNMNNWWNINGFLLDSTYVQAINAIGVSTPQPISINIGPRNLDAKAPIISMGSITSTTAAINVLYNSTLSVTGITGYIYSVQLIQNSIDQSPFSVSNNTIDTTASKTITLSGLSPNTLYHISISKNRAGGNVLLSWRSAGSNILSFTTTS